MRKFRIIVMLTLTVASLSLFAVMAQVGAAPPLHHASGGGFLVMPNNHEVMFAFNARQLDGVYAEGQFEQHDRTGGGIIHMEIFYMEIDGNEVWLIGEITKSINTNANIGDERAVRLQDNGEGSNALLDFRSKLYKDFDFPSPPLNGQVFDLIPLEGGNIQIR